MRTYLMLLLLFSCCLFNAAAFADMDCDKGFISPSDAVSEGYTTEKIAKLCGSPTKIKTWDEETLTKYRDGYLDKFSKTTTHYSMWTYNRGSNTFIEYLLFKDGMLIDLRDGDYGSD